MNKRTPHPSEVTVHEGVTGVLQRVQFVREMTEGFQGRACLVKDKETGDHFIVSSVSAPFTGPETLVFRADEDGNVTDWMEVAGGRRVSRTEAMEDLESRLDEGRVE